MVRRREYGVGTLEHCYDSWIAKSDDEKRKEEKEETQMMCDWQDGGPENIGGKALTPSLVFFAAQSTVDHIDGSPRTAMATSTPKLQLATVV